MGHTSYVTCSLTHNGSNTWSQRYTLIPFFNSCRISNTGESTLYLLPGYIISSSLVFHHYKCCPHEHLYLYIFVHLLENCCRLNF